MHSFCDIVNKNYKIISKVSKEKEINFNSAIKINQTKSEIQNTYIVWTAIIHKLTPCSKKSATMVSIDNKI